MLLLAVAVAVAVAFLPALDAATEHWVGDGKGWMLGFNYTAWAQTKQFKVGDTLGNYKHSQLSMHPHRHRSYFCAQKKKKLVLRFGDTRYQDLSSCIIAVFKYNKPSHTVVEVSGADFAACSPPETAKVLTTGQDKVALDSPGRRWFVCSVGAHCLNGMKVRIDVLAADDNAVSPAAPAPSGPASNVQARLALAVLAVAAVAAVLVL